MHKIIFGCLVAILAWGAYAAQEDKEERWSHSAESFFSSSEQ